MNLEVSAKSKETNTIEDSTMYVVFKDSKQMLMQDSLGCVYSLDLVDNNCSCGNEILPCPHLAFYYKKIARHPQCVNICGICYESNQYAETCCFACKSLFHLDCIQQLTKLTGETCPVCKAAWKKVPRTCTHCRFTRNPPYYMCLKCPEATICKQCRDMKIHPSHALICCLGGYWSAGIMPCVELLRRAMEIRPGICSECGNHAEDLSKLRCGHLMHKTCLEKKMYEKRLKCGVCKVSMFGCLDVSKSRYNSPAKSRSSSPSKLQGTVSTIAPSSLYNIQSNRAMSSRFIPSPPLLKNRSYTPNRQPTFKLENNKHEL